MEQAKIQAISSKDIEIYSTFLKNAVTVIDAIFGEDYAKAHPELVSVLVQAMVTEANIKMMAESLAVIATMTEANTKVMAETLQQGLTGIANAIEQGGLVEGR